MIYWQRNVERVVQQVVAQQTADNADPVTKIAARSGATRTQVALAWLLHRSPVIIPIPGTSSQTHLEDNVAAAQLHLGTDDYTQLATLG